MNLPALKEIIEERKGKAIERLQVTYAENRLPLEEYERLVEYINKIESERELAVVEKIVTAYSGAEYRDDDQSAPVNNGKNDDRNCYNEEPDYYSHQPYLQLPGNLTILSSRTFTGPVRSGSQYVSILGSAHIKIRKSDMDKRRTVLNVVSILGDSVIFVEPGIRVINRAIPILGGAWVDQNLSKQSRSGDPELVISGATILGNITVKLLKE